MDQVEIEEPQGEQKLSHDEEIVEDCSENQTEPQEEVSVDSDHSSEPKDKVEIEQKKVSQQHIEKLLGELEAIPDLESKVQYVITFMESSIAQSGAPHFKSFWEARQLCSELFKENVNPAVRGILWNQYNELSKEARRLKDVLDEQSAFAVEQIEIAIKALELEIQSETSCLPKVSCIEFNVDPSFFTHGIEAYQQLQKELNFLNVVAIRINSLRKELIRTDMRVRLKNKFFQRLSKAGDAVFPKRKELIRQVSDLFIADVDVFIEKWFKQDLKESFFSLREGIKQLQGMAKVLTLNTQAFNQTRTRLSESWDQLKGEEKEHKKERQQRKTESKQVVDEALAKLEIFRAALASGELKEGDAAKQLEEMGKEFRQLDLTREDLAYLKEQFLLTRKPMTDAAQEKEQTHQRELNEKREQQRQQIQELKQQIHTLLEEGKEFDVETLVQKRDLLIDAISASHATKLEKVEMERLLKPLRDLISDKQEKELLLLSNDDYDALQQLKEVLKQRKERRSEIKEQIDALRKTNGNSGLDFEQALNHNAQIEAEKERLDKINEGIKEIEVEVRRRVTQARK